MLDTKMTQFDSTSKTVVLLKESNFCTRKDDATTSPIDITACTTIAKAGVRYEACTQPRLLKNTPSRPMANEIRGPRRILLLRPPNVLNKTPADITLRPAGPRIVSNISSAG